ncbi:homeobox protein cut isoform X2 [Drosophila montana]|uniref:homeobox protein cut isoform X2 n=1 Tax=Drosophila montana TaxID=40370 RepID=UPI00313AE913
MQLELEQLAMMGHGPGEQHHLRHHNRHHAAWEQRVFPELHQRQHRLGLATSGSTAAPAAASLVTDAPLPHVAGNGNVSTRYFDRDGIYPAWTQPRSTRAPNWQQQVDDDSELDEDEDDDDDEDDEDEDEEEDYRDDEPVADDSFAAELAKQMPRYSFFSQKLPQISSMEQEYDAYDQSEPALTNNRHPNVAASHTKAAAKRNIFDWLFKPKTTTAKPQVESHAEEEEEEAFSNEQWNKIEHEHHLKQQQHQKELQALRDSNKNRNRNRNRNRNAPLIRARGGIDNEDADNNYSRNHIAGTLTAHKQKKLGTPEAVLNTQRQLAEDKAKAKAHMDEVRDENVCRVPQRRCLRVERETSKSYSPHCTSVYRCAEDSGCCPQRNQICAPKFTQKFEKHFNVMNHLDRRISVEMLTLVNHTECHCVERGKDFAEGHTASGGGVAGLQTELLTMPSFECPALFEKILGKDGKWRCDCSSSNDHCSLFKSGSEHFSLNDRKRIRQGLYKTPTCQYGLYIQKHGRCPTQHEQLPSYNALGMS